MRSLRDFIVYLITWIILWSCLAWQLELPVDLPVQAVKKVVAEISQAGKAVNARDTRYQQFNSFNSISTNRSQQSSNTSFPSSPKVPGAYDPVERMTSISGVSLWPDNNLINTYNPSNPWGVEPSIKSPTYNSPTYPGRITDPVKSSAGYSAYPKPNTESWRPSVINSASSKSAAGSTGSSYGSTAYGRR